VDDGKSTLIGRLLYDTQSVYEDQVRSIEGKGTTAPGQIDFALLTDGLRAEREQGITIDVAYRYFSTPRRKFIIADTPGHEQYTRNMATGASTADAAVVLIDAGKGVLVQSRRHAYIASLLRVRHVIVAVNKMDLIAYDESKFRAIERDFRRVLDQISTDTGNPVEPVFVPVSALAGDNVVHGSAAMPWYAGPSLLELLESLPSSVDTSAEAFRFPVQRVVRPDHSFRGFAGQIASGTIRPGDTITALPSGKSAQVDRIATDAPATVAKSVKAALVWMDQRPLERNRRYLIKHTSQTAPVFITSIHHRTDIGTLTHEPAESLEMNGIGVVTLNMLRPIAIDLYSENRATGAFILIDPETNGTVAAGMITATQGVSATGGSGLANSWGPVTAGEREARWGHRGGVLELSGSSELIDAIERSLFVVGVVTNRIEAGDEVFLLHPNLLGIVTRLQVQAGLLALVVNATDGDTLTARVEDRELILDADDSIQAVSAVHQLLHGAGIFIPSEKAGL
jgi:sulfate adenylyltransferase subunit 1 (EFTu-like GTPase family)